MTPLQKSTLLSQGLILKSDIESSVQKLLTARSSATKPENRIKAYREAQLDLSGVNENMTQLENLVAQASSNSSLMGFVGGVSTTAVFGIILVVVAGFVFMSSYFKRLMPAFASNLQPTTSDLESSPALESVSNEATSISSIPRLTPLIIPSSSGSNKSFWQMPAFITAVVIVTAVSTVALTRMAGSKSSNPQVAEVVAPSVAPSPSHVATPTPEPSITPSIEPSPSIKPSPSPTTSTVGSDSSLTHRIEVPSDSSVNIRNKPSSSADIIMALKESQDIVIFKEDGDWRNIGFSTKDTTKGYWVNIKFIVEK
jgi:hypothetical protein